MLCEYEYLTKDGREFGAYQCEDSDFKAFWRSRAKTDIKACKLVKGNGEIWIWCAPIPFKTSTNGWQRITPI